MFSSKAEQDKDFSIKYIKSKNKQKTPFYQHY